jgi:hypothetical protein
VSSPKLRFLPKTTRFLDYDLYDTGSGTLGERFLQSRRVRGRVTSETNLAEAGLGQRAMARQLGIDPSTLEIQCCHRRCGKG